MLCREKGEGGKPMAMTNSQKLDCLLEQMQIMNGRMDRLEGRMDRLEGRMDNVEGRLDKLESNQEALKAGQLRLSKELKRVSERVDETYQLALDAWGQSAENRALIRAF